MNAGSCGNSVNCRLFSGGNQFVIPVYVTRPAVTSGATRILPVFAALGTDAARIECVPKASAPRVAHPTARRPGNPFAFRTKDFYLAHNSPLRAGRAGR